MRDSLTLLAILVIVVLTAALVAPHFIDWNGQRGLIEAKLSQAAGTPVAIAGRIDVKLLPQPVFHLGEVSVGGGASGKPAFTAEAVDVSIALTALMRGEIEVVDATLLRPRLDLSGTGDPLPRLGQVGDPERFGFEHVTVRDGTLMLGRPDGLPLTVAGLDVEAEAASLHGPLKVAGRFGPATDRRPFRLSTGAFDKGKLRVKLGLDGAADRPAADFDGTLLAADGQPGFEGTVTVAGSIPVPGSADFVPWRLTGRAKGDAAAAELTDVELRAGDDMRALASTGRGEAILAGSPALTLTLHGTQLDADKLAVAPEGATTPPPQGFALLKRLGGLGNSLAAMPFTLALDYDLDTATVGGQTILGVAGHLGIKAGEPLALRVAAKGPDAARLLLDGTVETGAAPVFRGRLEAATRDVGRFADWLAPVLPGAPDWVRRTIPARALSLAGTVDLSGVGFMARDLRLTLDRTAASGTLAYTAAVGGEPGRLYADLSSDALDLDTLPDLEDTHSDWGDLDLDLAFQARAVTIVPTGIGPVDAGRLALRLKKSDAVVTLDDLSAEIGSARVAVTGHMEARTAALDAHVEAPQLDAVAGALARLLPGRLTGLVQAQAAALSPARLDIRLEAARGPDGALLPSAVTLAGTVDGSRLSASLKPDQPGDLDPATTAVTATLKAEAADGTVLMRQLGLPVAGSPAAGLPAAKGAAAPDAKASTLGAIGAGTFEGTAHGSLVLGFDASASLGLGGTKLGFRGRAKPGLGSGRLTLQGDLAPVLRAAGLAQPQAGAAWAADAQADLSWHDSSLSFRRLAGRLDDIGVSGDVNADLAPQPAAASADGAPGRDAKPVLFGALSIDRLPAAALLGLGFGTVPSPASGSGANAPWSDTPFGAAVLRLPRTEIALKVGTIALRDGLDARNASLTLRAERGAVILADMVAGLREGRLGATLTLRRDGPSASLNGAVSWSGVPVERPGFAGRIGGALDVAGTGASPAALVAGLAGTGTVRILDGRIPGLDPGAVARVASASEANSSEIDADAIGATLDRALAKGPLSLGDATGPATLATGLLSLGPFRVDGGAWTADLDASLDLKTLAAAAKVMLTARDPLPDWKGGPAQVTVRLDGPLGAPLRRSADAAAFVNTLQARAIARDQERIDILQQDIRERAYFNRVRKAIEADQQAARERARAEEARPQPSTEPSRPGPAAPAGRAPLRPRPTPGATRLPAAPNAASDAGSLKLPEASSAGR